MVDQNENEAYDTAQPIHSGSQPVKQGMSGCAMAAIGFGVFALILLIIGGAGIYYVAQNIRGIAANMVTPALQEIVSKMEIPTEQKTQISARISELGTSFKDETLTLNDLQAIMQGVVSSPLAGAAGTIWFTEQYIAKSGLNAAEQKDATMTTRRFAKGLLDKSIGDKEANGVMDLMSEKGRNGETNFKEKLTDKELNEVLKKMKTAADAANIATDVPEINFAKEFDKVIDEALGKTTNAADTEPEATNAPADTEPKATNAPADTEPEATKAPADTEPEATNAPADTEPEATNAPADTEPEATKAPAETVTPSP